MNRLELGAYTQHHDKMTARHPLILRKVASSPRMGPHETQHQSLRPTASKEATVWDLLRQEGEWKMREILCPN